MTAFPVRTATNADAGIRDNVVTVRAPRLTKGLVTDLIHEQGLDHPRCGNRRVIGRFESALAVALTVLLAGAGAAVVSRAGQADAATAQSAASTSGLGDVRASAEEKWSIPAGDPLRVRIPAIGVVAPLVPLGLNADGTLEVPSYDRAGWYVGGPRPGQPGPAVVAAHVDSRTGPAVFYRLKELQPGHEVHIDYAGGASVGFVVRETGRYSKSGFPTAEVYGRTEGPELRLITCTGTFDRSARSYRDNLVVWADISRP